MALEGTIRVPSDKSLSHRAVLFAGLAKGTSHLENVLPSADVFATIDAMKTLGAQIDFEAGAHGLSGTVTGIALRPIGAEPYQIYCGNSGTSARLLLGVLTGLKVAATLTGDASLSRRPMKRVMTPLERLGGCFESVEGTLPVEVIPARGLHAARLETGQASAQVKSAILLAGMQIEGTTSVTEPFKSRDHTELLLPAFGVDVKVDGQRASVTGPVIMHSHDMSIPADPSSAAFVAVAAALVPGSRVRLESVALNATRIGALKVLKRMGCDIAYESESMEGSEPVGDVVVGFSPSLHGVRVSSAAIPSLIDEIPVLALAAARAEGETVFESVGELRVKESDRLAAILEALEAVGIEAFVDGDDLHIMGADDARFDAPSSVCLSSRGDHRLAMTWHLMGLVFDCEVRIDDTQCVDVSWPDFFADIESLRR